MSRDRWWQSNWFNSLMEGAGDLLGEIISWGCELLGEVLANLDW